jgi:hypothetical protein
MRWLYLKKTLNVLARRTGFVRRKRKLLAYDFLVLMTVRQLSMTQPSLEAMVEAIEGKISREALHGRFTKSAADFMWECLSLTIRMNVAKVEVIDTRVLRAFDRILIFDSSSWDVAPALISVLPGSGGGASTANCKLQAGYEYKSGTLGFFTVTPGIKPDQAYSQHVGNSVVPGDLALFDLGYFRLRTFKQIDEKGAYFLSRWLIGTNLRAPETGALFDLGAFLQHFDGDAFEMEVLLVDADQQNVHGRLIGQRVSAEVACARRRRLRRESKKKGRTPSRKHLALCDWTLLVTNAPKSKLPAKLAYSLYRVRWQIELVFKQLKSVLRVNQTNTGKEYRLRCELYGKLIMAVLIHSLHASFHIALWNQRKQEVSFDKFYKRIREQCQCLVKLFLISTNRAMAFLSWQIPHLIKFCMKRHQPSRKTTLERLDLANNKSMTTFIPIRLT